ncbi:Uncharacterised protein [Mycobacteroides abscessus subsp. bolletii]|nr:Uncharacterised protein [Mycobacteroides abscessus subsp. bolletii]
MTENMTNSKTLNEIAAEPNTRVITHHLPGTNGGEETTYTYIQRQKKRYEASDYRAPSSEQQRQDARHNQLQGITDDARTTPDKRTKAWKAMEKYGLKPNYNHFQTGFTVDTRSVKHMNLMGMVDYVEKTTGKPRPESRAKQLDAVLEEIKTPANLDDAFHAALLNLDAQQAKAVLVEKYVQEYASLQLEDSQVIEDARLHVDNVDLNNYFAYIMENLEDVINAFNTAAKKFPKLWNKHAKAESLTGETISDELLEVSQVIAGALKFRQHLTEYFGYKVTGKHASLFSRNRAFPVHYQELPKLPANNDWKLYPVVDAARLFSYRPKPGHSITVTWGDEQTLESEDVAFTRMFEALNMDADKPNINGREIDVYEYWTNLQ